MLKAIHNLSYGFMPLYPVPSMTTPIKWFGALIGSGIASKALDLSKYLCLYIILWGMWGDIVISLMQRGFTAPHVRFFIGEIPHKKWGAEKLQNHVRKAVPHKKRGELPTTENATSLARRGFEAYLPNSPRFITTYTTIFFRYAKISKRVLLTDGPVRVKEIPLFLSFSGSINLNYSLLSWPVCLVYQGL
jgi:hypothetical protein